MPAYVYECADAHCGHVTERVYKTYPDAVPDSVPCEQCGRHALRSYKHEQGHMRTGDLPDWTSINAGVMPLDVPRANKHYAPMGVTFDKQGNAHVPGNVRRKFLKERGMHEL